MSDLLAKLKNIQLNKKTLGIIAGLAVIFIVWRVAANIIIKNTSIKTVPLVRTITIGSTEVSNEYTYPGEVRGRYESNLAFQVGGKIIKRSINLGDTVSAGQVLMTLDAKDVQQSVNAALAAVNSANANNKLCSDNARRYATLYSQGAVSEAVRDQYQTQYEAAAATLEQAQAQLSAANNQLAYTELRADHDGVISAVNGEIGMVVGAGTPVISLVQSGEREIQIYVPENRLGTIHPGQACSVTFWALNNTKSQGTVSEIAPMADAATHTYKVRVAINAMPSAARLGMTAKVVLKEGSDNAILLPRSAIYQTADNPQVWLVKDKKATLQSITVSGYKNDKVIVTSGLQSGDVVVYGGISQLSDGMEVRLEGGVSK